MFVFGILTSILWASIITILLWVLCAISGKFINASFRFPPLLHILCFIIAVPTIIFLVIVFSCNKLNRFVSKVEDNISKVLLTDGRLLEQISKQIVLNADTEAIKENISEEFTESISSEYPMLKKYIDTEKIKVNLNFGKISPEIDVEKTAKHIIRQVSGEFIDGIRSKIKSARLKSLIVVIVLQLICFGVVFYKASNYRSPVRRVFDQNDYM